MAGMTQKKPIGFIFIAVPLYRVFTTQTVKYKIFEKKKKKKKKIKNNYLVSVNIALMFLHSAQIKFLKLMFKIIYIQCLLKCFW